MSNWIDLGSGFSMSYFGWAPDRTIEANRIRYENIPDVERLGIIVKCPHGEGAVNFDRGDIYKTLFNSEWWKVEQEEPLTISPSVLCKPCGCHGFIQEGRWKSA